MTEGRADDNKFCFCVTFEIGNPLTVLFLRKIFVIKRSCYSLSRVRLLANYQGFDLFPPVGILQQVLDDLFRP